ncbi:B- and T-lymphocyte attenuator isoform X2 [Salmo salar]|uniref:B- and T-lymphocyte attenuator isoform X2 n=1 Tax=Salmo salar TaxID=8030 RepID=A0ABM3E1U7_SALSA|nr:B- and T-lymphocyte attenuator-like isoform X2 [Salmo salar]
MCIISELKTKAQMKRMDTYQSNEGGKGLVGFILLLLAKQLQGQGPICDDYIRVYRNTVVQAFVMEKLTINCTVGFCNDLPQVTWCKLDQHSCNPVIQTTHIQTQWNYLTSNSGISILHFTNPSIDDAGLYRCSVNTDQSIIISHSITVIVNDCQAEFSVSDDCWWSAPISGSVTVSCGNQPASGA